MDLALAPPVAKTFGMISTLAVDPKTDEIYLLQRGKGADPIVVVNRKGEVLRSWGKGLFTTPHGIRIDPEGNVWTTDATSSVVYKFTRDGRKLLQIAVGEQPGPGSFKGITDIAFGPNGRVFIADGYGNARILEYSGDGKRVRQWGSHGTGPGQFDVPHAIVVDSDNIIYVGDRENGRVQKFDLDGRYLGEWDGLGKPMTLTLLNDGTMLVASGYHNAPKQTPEWLAWVYKMERKTGKILGYLEVGDDAHAASAIDNGSILTGGETNGVTAVHWFSAAH